MPDWFQSCRVTPEGLSFGAVLLPVSTTVIQLPEVLEYRNALAIPDKLENLNQSIARITTTTKLGRSPSSAHRNCGGSCGVAYSELHGHMNGFPSERSDYRRQEGRAALPYSSAYGGRVSKSPFRR